MILIDHLVQYRRQFYCHMISTISITDLHQFAEKIGLKRHWFHKDHYDLNPQNRLKAVLYGAQETTSREIVKFRNDTRQSKH